MTENRPPIPADLKRRVLVEAGHRCSIPTCRQIICEVHHIIEWSEVKEHKYENLICLCANCHSLAHSGKIDRKSLRLYKHNLGQLHDKYTQFEIDLLFDLHKAPKGVSFYVPDFMYYMFRRTVESGMIKILKSEQLMVIGEVGISYLFVTITESGRNFIDNLSRE
jgi:hypothetical protein